MSITPQAIKDQEFQVKFRGYDTIEVKAYLELLAEEFFELHEAQRRQDEAYSELQEANDTLRLEKEVIEKVGREAEERTEASIAELDIKDKAIAGLEDRVAELEKQLESSEQEKNLQQEAWEKQETELRKEIETLHQQLQDRQSAATESSGETDKMRAQIELLEAEIEELKKEEVDFKTTLVAAQKFADDVRKKAEEEADRLLEEAQEEVDAYRNEVEAELASLPGQIDELRRKKSEVAAELRAVLMSHLDQLDTAVDSTANGTEADLSDLFQSISLSDDDAIDPAGTDQAEG